MLMELRWRCREEPLLIQAEDPAGQQIRPVVYETEDSLLC